MERCTKDRRDKGRIKTRDRERRRRPKTHETLVSVLPSEFHSLGFWVLSSSSFSSLRSVKICIIKEVLNDQREERAEAYLFIIHIWEGRAYDDE